MVCVVSDCLWISPLQNAVVRVFCVSRCVLARVVVLGAVRPWQRLDRGHPPATAQRSHEATSPTVFTRRSQPCACAADNLTLHRTTSYNIEPTSDHVAVAALRRRCRVAPQARRTAGPARTVRKGRRIRRPPDKIQLRLGLDQIERTRRPARRRAPAFRNLPRKP